MFTEDQIRALPGAEVYDDAGSEVGTVGQVWSDTGGQPSWVSVNTGMFGYNESLMPLLGAYFSDGALHTPYAAALVIDAPNVDINAEQPLNSSGLDSLYTHYSLTLDTGGQVTSGDDAMTRSEEHLTVGMESRPTGKVRLRKHIVTEYVTTTVPVWHEEVRLEHVPLDETDAVPADTQTQVVELGDADHDVVLYAERPVVTTETVPVERVRLGKQIVTEQQTVGGAVRKERIELDMSQQPTAD